MRRTILVLDDDAFVLRHIERVLGASYAILTASTHDEARLLFDAENVAVILCDLKLGQYDGAEFMHEVQRTHPHIRRVLMSGVNPEVLNHYRDSGLVHATLNKGESSNADMLAAVRPDEPTG